MGNKVRVLVATGTMNAGGAETLIMEQLRQKSENVEYTMLIHNLGEVVEGVYDAEIKAMGIPVINIGSVGYLGQKRYIEEFCEVIKNYGPFDVIHSHLNAVGGVISKAAKRAGIENRIVHCHADITFRGSIFSRIINELKLQIMRMYIDRYATDCWACSEAAAKRLFYSTKISDSVIIPNIIDVSKYLKKSDSKEKAKEKFGLQDRLVIGAVGRIAGIKNYEFVVDLLDSLKKNEIIADFVCFGRVVDEEYYDDILEKARQFGVVDQLHFLGNSTDVSFDIHCFDIFVMPSYSEGFGMAAIEAQAAGIPSVVSTGVPNIVDVNAGLIDFISLNDMELWVRKIKSLIDDDVKVENDLIIGCFDKCGYNSVTTAKKIEKKYLEMKSKG